MMNEWDAQTAEWYAEHYGEYATNRLAVSALELGASETIVDIGCGTGAALREASLKVVSGKLIGVDPVERMVEIARERLQNHSAAHRIEFLVGPAEDIPLKANLADWVFAFDSIDHWQNKTRGLSEISRILKPAGRLAMVKDGGVPEAAGKARALDQTLEAAGFTILKRQNIEADEIKFTLWLCEKPE
jgi:ubiquinone/menaquinone biosynthesis C-methylase UbiE